MWEDGKQGNRHGQPAGVASTEAAYDLCSLLLCLVVDPPAVPLCRRCWTRRPSRWRRTSSWQRWQRGTWQEGGQVREQHGAGPGSTERACSSTFARCSIPANAWLAFQLLSIQAYAPTLLACRLAFLERYARVYDACDKCIQTDDLPGEDASAQFPSLQVGCRGWGGAALCCRVRMQSD